VPGGVLEATLAEGDRPVGHVAWSPDGSTIAASGDDGATVLWDWRGGRARARLDHGRGRVVADFHPDGSVLATGTSGRLVTLWDPATGAKLRECAGHNEAVDAVAFSPDGARLATGGSDNTLRLWDWRSCANVLSLPFASGVYEMAWSPDGDRLLAAPLDGTVVRLDAASPRAR
jgi:WD40 repeat protein